MSGQSYSCFALVCVLDKLLLTRGITGAAVTNFAHRFVVRARVGPARVLGTSYNLYFAGIGANCREEKINITIFKQKLIMQHAPSLVAYLF